MKQDQEYKHYKHMIQPQEFHELVEGIQRALFTFESTSNHAVIRLYRKNIFSGRANEENAILTGNEGEHVFLVYLYVNFHSVTDTSLVFSWANRGQLFLP